MTAGRTRSAAEMVRKARGLCGWRKQRDKSGEGTAGVKGSRVGGEIRCVGANLRTALMASRKQIQKEGEREIREVYKLGRQRQRGGPCCRSFAATPLPCSLCVTPAYPRGVQGCLFSPLQMAPAGEAI